jgi:hypothetical protein
VMIEWLTPGFVYTLAKDVFKLRTKKRRLSPTEVMALRSKWKPEFEKYIWERHRKELRSDSIVRDMSRVDHYPNAEDKGKGISPWFRTGLVGTYHRGIYVSHRWGGLVKDGNGWRYPNYKVGETWQLKVLLMSSIPYENIEHVDWEGDEYYNYPHIYCWFNNKKEPYEDTSIYVKHDPLVKGLLPFFEKVADVEDVRRRSRKQGLSGHFS